MVPTSTTTLFSQLGQTAVRVVTHRDSPHAVILERVVPPYISLVFTITCQDCIETEYREFPAREPRAGLYPDAPDPYPREGDHVPLCRIETSRVTGLLSMHYVQVFDFNSMLTYW
jgi:hypothetical protein